MCYYVVCQYVLNCIWNTTRTVIGKVHYPHTNWCVDKVDFTKVRPSHFAILNYNKLLECSEL